MTTHRPWQDVLLGHADQLDTAVISPTMDDAVVEAALRDFIRPASGKPGMHLYAAQLAAQSLQETVAQYGTRLSRTRAQAERAEVADAVRGIGPRWDEAMPDDHDPTDAELERSWNGPDAHEAHRAAWALHQETRSA